MARLSCQLEVGKVNWWLRSNPWCQRNFLLLPFIGNSIFCQLEINIFHPSHSQVIVYFVSEKSTYFIPPIHRESLLGNSDLSDAANADSLSRFSFGRFESLVDCAKQNGGKAHKQNIFSFIPCRIPPCNYSCFKSKNFFQKSCCDDSVGNLLQLTEGQFWQIYVWNGHLMPIGQYIAKLNWDPEKSLQI